jgi:threonyl-tRNA synthetase
MKKQQKQSDLEHLRHSLAHLLAAAVMELWPDTKRAIGPAIENGFYYDFDFGDADKRACLPVGQGSKARLPTGRQGSPRISESDLPRIEKKMRELLPTWDKFTKHLLTAAAAKKEYPKNPYKHELINEFSERGKKKLSFYRSGDYWDLCRGGHVASAREIRPDAFKLTRIAGAYWRGDEKNKMLTRIYAVAFRTKKELDEHLTIQAEAEKRDHKKLGPALDLFAFSELVGSGLPLWTPRGTLLRDLLDDYVWQLRKARGYAKVEIPHITRKDLYERSGHWEKFKDDLFKIVTREGHVFALKPMNCPHHIQIFARRPWSYRELPQRYANTTMQYRDEQTGELAGLSRVRSISIDDAHVFCRRSQIKEEFLKVWDIIHEFYRTFGFTLRIRLSLHDPKHPEKYLGDKKVWKAAEDMLRAIVKEKKADASEDVGEAAFYGPKLDFMAKDSIGREWQVATIQLDMNQPERFDLTCTNENGQPERIVMIHAAIMGSIERFLAIAIEHFAGAFPVWLAPVQVSILPVSEKLAAYGEKILSSLEAAGIRAELGEANETLGKRIREAELMKIPYILVVGEKEAAAGTVNVRHYRHGQEGEVKIEKLIEKVAKEITDKVI